MNISSEIFTSDGSNSSDHLFYNDTVLENSFAVTSVLAIIIISFDFPINSYVIWLIVTGTGNGLAAEFFNLNLAVCEIFLLVETLLSHFNYEAKIVIIVVIYLSGLAITCRPVFQCLICVERYLAVVHPVTFLKYKTLRYRVICAVIAWVASFVSGGVILVSFNVGSVYIAYYFGQFLLFLCIQLFCLVTVLRALKQSGPGERRREREEENHMKRRAFYVILITTMTMLIMYGPYIIIVALYSSIFYLYSSKLPDILSSIGFVCFTLAGLGQPLLFLYRVGKLPLMKCQ